MFDHLRMKWNTFIYNFQWPDYVWLFDGWIAKCSMAVPIVGYLILFNDTISQHVAFNNLANEHLLSFGISSVARLKLIYFGLVFLGASNIWYRIRRPYALRLGTDQFEYVEVGLKHFTASDYIQINGEIKGSGLDPYTHHGKYYDSEFAEFIKLAIGDDNRLGIPRGTHWAEAKSRYEGLLRSMLIENFFRQKIQRRYSLTFCITLSLVGYVFLLIPSSDLFLKVMSSVFGVRV
jgi:hypothetical protein